MKCWPLITWFALLPLAVFADDQIKWGQPVSGLRIGIEGNGATITADQDVTFTVTAQNVSSQSISLPTPETFLLKGGRDDDFHETPLSPVIKPVAPLFGWGTTTEAITSAAGPTVESLQPHVIVLAPGQSVTWHDVPLGKSQYTRFREFDNHVSVQRSVLLQPASRYQIQFRYENDQTPVANAAVWTGVADSAAVELQVKAPSLEGIKVEGGFSLPKPSYVLGQPIEVTFAVVNKGEKSIHFVEGGDYRASGRHDRFSFHAVDSWGWSVADPLWSWRKALFPFLVGGEGGGMGTIVKLKPGASYSDKLAINAWCSFQRAGKYKVTCKRTLSISVYEDNDPNRLSKPEASLPAVPIETTLELTIEGKP